MCLPDDEFLPPPDPEQPLQAKIVWEGQPQQPEAPEARLPAAVPWQEQPVAEAAPRSFTETDPRALEQLFADLDEETLMGMKHDDPRITKVVGAMRGLRKAYVGAEAEGRKPRSRGAKKKLTAEEIEQLAQVAS